MAMLGDLARLIRSKNAGAFSLTFDIMFDDDETYQRVVRSKVLNKDLISRLYRLPPEDVTLFEHDAAKAVKVSIPRPIPQCDILDGDAYGGQQYAPLVTLQIPDE